MKSLEYSNQTMMVSGSGLEQECEGVGQMEPGRAGEGGSQRRRRREGTLEAAFMGFPRIASGGHKYPATLHLLSSP